jgi:hypothetical protein
MIEVFDSKISNVCVIWKFCSELIGYPNGPALKGPCEISRQAGRPLSGIPQGPP